MVELKSGQLVRSLMGRDKGKHYIVIQELAQGYVLLADGKVRTLAQPKRKNKIHLQIYERHVCLGEPGDMKKLTDSLIIRYLKELAPVKEVPEEEV
ncbi:MAG TPA: KOW domain-containing RNA-binding protein [Candidatus Limnocylindrales bacterium]|nr:KOW domain-containing RNA-binding protein [Candidatus Limnocylindrales bacterium]